MLNAQAPRPTEEYKVVSKIPTQLARVYLYFGILGKVVQRHDSAAVNDSGKGVWCFLKAVAAKLH
jgi:hypothetical protein